MTPQEHNAPSPIFQIGTVPQIPHCTIQKREYVDGKWMYAIHNQYNSYASGWGDEDFLIKQIELNGTTSNRM